jgi:peptidoglycan hydrolase CwlO-like protein
MMKQIFAAIMLMGLFGITLAENAKVEAKEINLTEAQANKLELAAQRLLNAQQELQLLQARFKEVQDSQGKLASDFQATLTALCQEYKLDISKTKPSQDWKKLVGPELKPEVKVEKSEVKVGK